MTVSQLLINTTSREITEWQLWYKIKDEPPQQDANTAMMNMKAAMGGIKKK